MTDSGVALAVAPPRLLTEDQTMNAMAADSARVGWTGRYTEVLQRAGKIGFWFFLVKGLMWLAAPWVIYLAAGRGA
jgi:hypothetical protein